MTPGGLLSVALLLGLEQPDARLVRYRFEPRARLDVGGELRIALPPGSVALRGSYGRGEQATGLAEPSRLAVGRASLDGVLRIPIAGLALADLSLAAAAGRAVFRYTPDRVVIREGSAPLVARFPATGAWTAGLGLELGVPRAPLHPELALERSFAWLPAAHRRGEEVVRQEERIGFWKARVQLVWRI